MLQLDMCTARNVKAKAWPQFVHAWITELTPNMHKSPSQKKAVSMSQKIVLSLQH